MIKFFRKIRQKFLREKRFSSYMAYAVGEVVLVVIGILLALQFNNWSLEKSNEKKERWYLINIVEDIVYQKKDLKYLKERYQKSIQVAKQILKDYKKQGSFAKIDSLNYKLNSLMVVEIFPNTNNTYQELVNSGQQTLIQNKELSIDIIDFYLFCDDNYRDVKNNNDNVFYKEIHPVFYGLHQTSLIEMELPKKDKELLWEDKETNAYLLKKLELPENKLKMLNALKTNILMDDYHLSMVEETLEAGIDLIKKIDTYLGLTPDMVNNYD